MLKGAARLIQDVRPRFAIDIHAAPFARGTTEAPVRHTLAEHGYRFSKLNHVLLCEPA